jgi:hypothetical protein
MLFRLNTAKKEIDIVERIRLVDVGWDERKLQELLFRNLDRVIQDEELLLILQSRRWQEEPDLMAVDEKGDLWIFELKAWESQQSNILQALRYGQKFGQYDYDDLEEVFNKISKEKLSDAHSRRFTDRKITQDQFNKAQHFVIITNGLDAQTREAITFWRERGLDVRPWIYRIYRTKNKELYLEFNTFRTRDDPFEDIEEGYFVVNTNFRNDKRDDKEMLMQKKAAAFFDPWKQAMKRIQVGNRVFLYRSGEGIVARGIAKSRYGKRDYHANPKDAGEEYYVELKNFLACKHPLPASEIVNLTGINYRFMKTCFTIDKESGKKIWDTISKLEKVEGFDPSAKTR